MQFHFHANQSHFHKNGFTLRLVLKQRLKGTWKWPINLQFILGFCCKKTLFFSLHADCLENEQIILQSHRQGYQ